MASSRSISGLVVVGILILAVAGFVAIRVGPDFWSPRVPEEPAAVAPTVVEPVEVQVQPAPEPAPEPPAAPPPPPEAPPSSFAEGYGRVKVGMTYEEVCVQAGDNMSVVGTSKSGMRMMRWSGGDRQAFTARFRDGKLDKLSRLQNMPAPLTPSEIEARAAQSAAAGRRHAARMQDQQEAEEAKTAAETAEAGEEADEPADGPADEPADGGTEEEEQAPAPSDSGVVTQSARSERVVRIGVEAAERKGRPSVRKARLPRSSGQINRGANDVIFFNHSENPVQVGVRLGMRGKDFNIPSGGTATLFLSNGSYTIHYIDQGEPETLQSGGSLTVDSPPVALRVDLGQ